MQHYTVTANLAFVFSLITLLSVWITPLYCAKVFNVAAALCGLGVLGSAYFVSGLEFQDWVLMTLTVFVGAKIMALLISSTYTATLRDSSIVAVCATAAYNAIELTTLPSLAISALVSALVAAAFVIRNGNP